VEGQRGETAAGGGGEGEPRQPVVVAPHLAQHRLALLLVLMLMLLLHAPLYVGQRHQRYLQSS
jgi:hypothetical protein